MALSAITAYVFLPVLFHFILRHARDGEQHTRQFWFASIVRGENRRFRIRQLTPLEQFSPAQSRRCGHFQVEAQIIPVSEAGITMRVPVRRCLLAERMIRHLSTSDEGREIARKLTIAGSASPLSGAVPSAVSGEAQATLPNAGDAEVRAAFGPDLEVITALECTSPRCRESCTPGYQSFLRHFGFFEIAESETGVGCEPTPAQEAEALALPHRDT